MQDYMLCIFDKNITLSLFYRHRIYIPYLYMGYKYVVVEQPVSERLYLCIWKRCLRSSFNVCVRVHIFICNFSKKLLEYTMLRKNCVFYI